MADYASQDQQPKGEQVPIPENGNQNVPRELFKAWLKAKSEVEMPTLDAENPHFHNKYASLGSCLEAIRPALRAAKLNYQQVFDGTAVRSILFDSDGNSLTLSTFPITEGLSPQATGSALTYAKRQAICVDFGIVGEPDDDGEEATKESAANGDSAKRAAYRTRIASLMAQLRESDKAEDAVRLLNERRAGRDLEALGERELLELGTSLAALIEQAEAERRQKEEA